MLQAFPLEQLSTNSFFCGFRYICRCSSTSFRQVRCSWPQKTLQRNRRRNNIRIYAAGTDILVEVKQEYTSTFIQRFFFQYRKRSNQGYPRHHHFILSNITQHKFTSALLTLGIPLPMLHQRRTAWGLDSGPGISESKTLHTWSCLPGLPTIL